MDEVKKRKGRWIELYYDDCCHISDSLLINKPFEADVSSKEVIIPRGNAILTFFVTQSFGSLRVGVKKPTLELFNGIFRNVLVKDPQTIELLVPESGTYKVLLMNARNESKCSGTVVVSKTLGVEWA